MRVVPLRTLLEEYPVAADWLIEIRVGSHAEASEVVADPAVVALLADLRRLRMSPSLQLFDDD